MSNRSQALILDEARAQFIQGTVSLTVASRDARMMPSVSKAIGCRVSSARDEVTILLPITDAGALLEHIRSTGALALVVSEPVSHEALQIKADDAREVDVRPGDAALASSYLASFAALVDRLGYPAAFVQQIRGWDVGSLAAVAFTPNAAFLQTPGPRAGEPLEPLS